MLGLFVCCIVFPSFFFSYSFLFSDAQSQDDRGTAALLATGLSHDSRRSGCDLQRVLEGQEPDHFISHFAGYQYNRSFYFPSSSFSISFNF
jgi:hypothetical protein